MEIAYVTDVVYPFTKGGGEKRTYEVGRRLASEGHMVTVYSRQWWDGPEERMHEGMRLRGVAPECDLYGSDGRRSIQEAIGFAARVVRPLASDAREYDVIVTMAAPYFHVLTSKLASMFSDAALVTMWHEVWLDHWDEYLCSLAVGGKLVERAVARTPHHPLTVSEMTADRLGEIRSDRSDITVIPNGIDINQIRSSPRPSTGFDVLYAGRLIEDKKVEWVLKAFDRVADNHDITLGIIGDGPQRRSLERVADQLENSERITFTGFLDEYKDVLGHMRAADVFVSPSIREGFGMTLLEAMAADCAVLTVDHPHSAGSDIVGPGGFVTDPSVGAVTDTLERILNGAQPETDPVSRAEEYDWQNIATREAEFYRRISRV